MCGDERPPRKYIAESLFQLVSRNIANMHSNFYSPFCQNIVYSLSYLRFLYL